MYPTKHNQLAGILMKALGFYSNGATISILLQMKESHQCNNSQVY